MLYVVTTNLFCFLFFGFFPFFCCTLIKFQSTVTRMYKYLPLPTTPSYVGDLFEKDKHVKIPAEDIQLVS